MTRRERIEARVERRREWAESRDRKALHAASFHWGGGSWSGKTANIPEEAKREAEA